MNEKPAQNQVNNEPVSPIPHSTPPAGWIERCAEHGISFELGEVEGLGHYLALLLDENTRMNLTAIRDPDEAWDRHIFDAMTLLSVLGEIEPAGGGDVDDAGRGLDILDVGSGGGVPGIPLAIVMPQARFTLLDSTAKKTAFLERTVQKLGLTNVTVLTGRAESMGQYRGERTATGRTGGHRDRYDAVIARAVGRMVTLVEITVPMARVGGMVVMIKGQKADEELAEAKAALHLLHAAHSGTIESPTGRIVVLEKLRATPRDYPRRDGEPKRSPLGIGSAKS